MEQINLTCNNCGSRLKAKAREQARLLRCPKCNAVVHVPAQLADTLDDFDFDPPTGLPQVDELREANGHSGETAQVAATGQGASSKADVEPTAIAATNNVAASAGIDLAQPASPQASLEPALAPPVLPRGKFLPALCVVAGLMLMVGVLGWGWPGWFRAPASTVAAGNGPAVPPGAAQTNPGADNSAHPTNALPNSDPDQAHPELSNPGNTPASDAANQDNPGGAASDNTAQENTNPSDANPAQAGPHDPTQPAGAGPVPDSGVPRLIDPQFLPVETSFALVARDPGLAPGFLWQSGQGPQPLVPPEEFVPLLQSLDVRLPDVAWLSWFLVPEEAQRPAVPAAETATGDGSNDPVAIKPGKYHTVLLIEFKAPPAVRPVAQPLPFTVLQLPVLQWTDSAWQRPVVWLNDQALVTGWAPVLQKLGVRDSAPDRARRLQGLAAQVNIQHAITLIGTQPAFLQLLGQSPWQQALTHEQAAPGRLAADTLAEVTGFACSVDAHDSLKVELALFHSNAQAAEQTHVELDKPLAALLAEMSAAAPRLEPAWQAAVDLAVAPPSNPASPPPDAATRWAAFAKQMPPKKKGQLGNTVWCRWNWPAEFSPVASLSFRHMLPALEPGALQLAIANGPGPAPEIPEASDDSDDHPFPPPADYNPRYVRQLQTPLRRLHIPSAKLQDLLELLTGLAGLPLNVDQESLIADGVDAQATATLHADELSVAAALDLLAARHGFAWTLTIDGVQVEGRSHWLAGYSTVAYPLAGLGDSNDRAAQLASLITDTVQPDSWETQGGEARLKKSGNALWVWQAAPVHQQIAGLLARLQAASSGDETSQQVLATRANVLPRFLSTQAKLPKSKRASPGAMLHELERLTPGLVWQIDWPAMLQNNVTADMELPEYQGEDTVEAHLNWLCELLRLGHYLQDEHRLVVTTAQNAQSVQVIEVYWLRDVPAEARKSPTLLERVTAEVAPESWAINGGAGVAAWDETSACLIVRQTPQVQDQLEDTLLAWFSPQAEPDAPEEKKE